MNALHAQLRSLGQIAYRDAAVLEVLVEEGIYEPTFGVVADLDTLGEGTIERIELWGQREDVEVVILEGDAAGFLELEEDEDQPLYVVDPEDAGIGTDVGSEIGYVEIGNVAVMAAPSYPTNANPQTVLGARALVGWVFAHRAYLLDQRGEKNSDTHDSARAEDLARAALNAASYQPVQTKEAHVVAKASGAEVRKVYDLYENAMLEAVKAECWDQTEGIADFINEQVEKLGLMQWIQVPPVGQVPSPRWWALHIAQYLVAEGNPDNSERGLQAELAAVASELMEQPAWMDSTKADNRPGVLTMFQWLGAELPKNARASQHFVAQAGRVVDYVPPTWWDIIEDGLKDAADKGKKASMGFGALAGIAAAIAGALYVTNMLPRR